MKRNKIFLYILTSMVVLIGSGCKKYLDVNQNLNNPEVVPVSTQLTGAQRAIGNNLGLGGGLSAGLSVYMHQQTVRGAADQYSLTGDNGIIEGPWSGLYGAMKNLNVVIDQGTIESRLKYVGVAKILKAYAFSQMVDVWGDIPFSEFDQFKAGILQPKFDDDAAIYSQLFALLDAGIADINNTAINPSVPAGDDLIYNGVMSRWIKAANTIKLKLYTQVRKVQNVTPQVTALLASPSTLIASNAEMFVLPYGPLGASDDRNPGYGDYTASQRGQNVSPYFYEIMRGYSPIFRSSYINPLAGITDPRIPYYWYNQRTATATADNPTDYRDGPFISIVFGSVGPDRNGSQQTSYTLFGIYPVGGRYDDLAARAIGSGAGQITSLVAGTGAAPYKMITYADRLYLEAELINTGVVPGNAATVFSTALNVSFTQVDYIISNYVKPSQIVPVLASQPAVSTYITSVLALFNAASNAKQLEYIITEKWIASFGSSVDQYTDFRRTGYPVLFDPKDPAMAPGGFVQPPLTGNPSFNPQKRVAVTRANEFPLSLPWSQTEIELNANAPKQKPLPIVYKVFWMP